MQNAVAFANNDVITIAWSVEPRPAGCMGFTLYRIDATGQEKPLPSVAVFPGFTRKPGQTQKDFPLQKFYWKDPYARLIAESTGKRKFRYRIEPREGKPGALVPMNMPHMTTNWVEITPRVSPGVEAFFNRGLISTQRVSRAFKGKPSKGALLPRLADQKDPLRKSLAGEMIGALTSFADRAKSSGRIYAALYELGDAELIAELKKLGHRLSIVLSNAIGSDPNDKAGKKKIDTNGPARKIVSTSAQVDWDRIMPSGHIGHNKFLVYANSSGTPKAVLLGSTNWTSTGLCAQTNNTLIIEDDALAARYLEYWKKLAADTNAAKKDPKKLQAKPLRTWDAKGRTLAIPGAASLESWFSPNTPAARKTKTAGEKRPGDMAALVKHINEAKSSILFLAFYPGSPSVADWAADAQKANKDLFVRGCVTNPSASGAFYYELHGLTPPKKVKGQKTITKEDARVVSAKALDKTIPPGWLKELLNAGYAIVHDKIVVIDPFSDDCVVATGSHNLGHRASFNNDENLVIVKGNKALAAAYATHVLDVYDHFVWRWWVQQKGQKAADQFLKTKPDEWLDTYYDKAGTIRTAQLKFWMGAAPPTP